MRALRTALVTRQPAGGRLAALLGGSTRIELLRVPTLERAAALTPDCLLVDGPLAGDAAAFVPDAAVIALSSGNDLGAAVAAVRDGAEDALDPARVGATALARTLLLAVERHRARAELRHRALHDALTDLPNRGLLEDRLKQALATRRRDRRPLAVVFADLDAFKPVNDRLGHAAGDHVLLEVARRLQAAVRPGDTVARFGGDEFVVLCAGVGPDEIAPVTERIRAQVERPILVEQGAVLIGASIGVAFADDGTSAEELLHRADAAMYEVKSHGGMVAR